MRLQPAMTAIEAITINPSKVRLRIAASSQLVIRAFLSSEGPRPADHSASVHRADSRCACAGSLPQQVEASSDRCETSDSAYDAERCRATMYRLVVRPVLLPEVDQDSCR